jgi:hypothetical protein
VLIDEPSRYGPGVLIRPIGAKRSLAGFLGMSLALLLSFAAHASSADYYLGQYISARLDVNDTHVWVIRYWT